MSFHLYSTTFALITLFCAMWLLTPHAAISVAHQYDSVHQWNANATLVRLRARKQLMISHHIYGNKDNKEMHSNYHDRHRPTKQWVFFPISSDATVTWLRRLRLMSMV